MHRCLRALQTPKIVIQLAASVKITPGYLPYTCWIFIFACLFIALFPFVSF